MFASPEFAKLKIDFLEVGEIALPPRVSETLLYAVDLFRCPEQIARICDQDPSNRNPTGG
jgi:hypothetical protein